MKRILPLILCLVAAVACDNTKDDPALKELQEQENEFSVYTDKAQRQLTPEQTAMMAPLADFSFQFMKGLAGQFPDNDLCCSPLSAAYLLGMLGEGADGQTATEIYKALGITDRADLNQLCLNLMTIIQGIDPKVSVHIANAGVVDNSFLLLKDYREALKGWYDANVVNMNFTDEKLVLSYINGWVNRHTQGMIDKILEKVSEDAVAYFLNALYFKGDWRKPFEEYATYKQSFYGKQEKEVDMMHASEHFSYAKNSSFQMVRLPFAGGNFNMDILLPAGNVDAFLTSLNADAWKQAVGTLVDSPVRLSLPKFEINFFKSLKPLLKGMGIQAAFERDADFSRMSTKQVFVSEIMQKARIKVNEQGAEAAAVTIAQMGETAIMPGPEWIDFKADRPFVYILSEKTTGAILFTGCFRGE